MRLPALAVLPILMLAGAAAAQNQGLVLVNGTTGYIDVPYSPTLAPKTGITVEAWVTYNSVLPSGWRFPTILRMDPSPNVSSYFLRVEAGQTQTNRLLWWVSTTTGDYQLNWFYAAGALATWTHLAATYDGSAMRIFANGVQVAQGAASGTILDTNGIFRIGSGDLSLTGGETWNGEIDEVRVWPFARSAAAIASTMNMALAGIPGEVSTWSLDGHAVDLSGGNHGTAVGTAAFATNTLSLTSPLPGSLLSFGSGSGCHTDARIAANSIPGLGNAAFAFVGTHAPASPVGVMLLGTASLPGVPVLGVNVFVDFTTGVLATVLPTVLHTGETPLPIPSTAGLVGASVFAQCAWFDASCASGFSASDALVASIVP